MTKQKITRRLLLYQLVAFAVLAFLVVGDEVFDIPHYCFGFQATPINWPEALLEGSYILVLAGVSFSLSWKLLHRVKYLEGFLPICSVCKKVRVGKEWEQLERYMKDHSDATLSHGMCPDCAETYYGAFLKPRGGTRESEHGT